MNWIPQALLFLAGVVVLAEALNKLERCQPNAPGLSWRERVVDALKALAWMLLALGAGGAIAAPLLQLLGVSTAWLPQLLRLEDPTLDHVATMVGFAVLIVRTRVKEG